MSNDPNYELDELMFEDYYGTPDPDRPGEWLKPPIKSYRKLGLQYGCSYENVRRRIKRFRAFNERSELYGKFPSKIATLLVQGGLSTAKRIRESDDARLLKVKHIGQKVLKIIREVYPYEGSN